MHTTQCSRKKKHAFKHFKYFFIFCSHTTTKPQKDWKLVTVLLYFYNGFNFVFYNSCFGIVIIVVVVFSTLKNGIVLQSIKTSFKEECNVSWISYHTHFAQLLGVGMLCYGVLYILQICKNPSCNINLINLAVLSNFVSVETF